MIYQCLTVRELPAKHSANGRVAADFSLVPLGGNEGIAGVPAGCKICVPVTLIRLHSRPDDGSS